MLPMTVVLRTLDRYINGLGADSSKSMCQEKSKTMVWSNIGMISMMDWDDKNSIRKMNSN